MGRRKIDLFDTTLRDGEQGCGLGAGSLGHLEKYAIAQLLDQAGFDVIEAGFPISSDGDFKSVQYITQKIERAEVAALSRALEKDIRETYEAVKSAKRPRIHTFIAVSPVHMQKKLKASPDEVYKMAVNAVRYARSLLGNKGTVQFSGEDSFRAERDFLVKIYSGVIKAGADVINVPDTVGYAQPDEVFGLMRFLMQNVEGGSKIKWSFHGHDDLGNATSNSMAAIKAGVHQIEGTINGVGERAGTSALEEIVANLKTRKDFFKAYADVDTTKIGYISEQVSRLLDIPVQPNKAIVGANAFAHSSGIHQDGMIKDTHTYEIMNPSEWGWVGENRLLTERSGRNAIRKTLEEAGYTITAKELEAVYSAFKALAHQVKKVTSSDLVVILEDEIRKTPEVIKLVYASATGGTIPIKNASIQVMKDGTLISKVAMGTGTINALYNAVDSALDLEIELVKYEIRAIGSGKDVQGEITTIIRDDGKRFIGRGVSTDILEASVKAYINAINKMLYNRENNI